MLSMEVPASSRALYEHCRRSFCWGSMTSASASEMPKNLWSNSLNLEDKNGANPSQFLRKKTSNRWEWRKSSPVYQSGSGRLGFSRFGGISIAPKARVKPLRGDVHHAVLSLQQNLPEILQPLTCNMEPLLQIKEGKNNHKLTIKMMSHLLGNCIPSQPRLFRPPWWL